MDFDEIRRIIRFMDENGLVEFEHEESGKRVMLRKKEGGSGRGEPAPQEAPTQAGRREEAQEPADRKVGEGWGEIRSPLVGTFYRAGKPDAESYVNAGDEVHPEKVVCIVEAMKVMNEIKAEMNGIVREILVKNGQAVEYGEPLFLVEKK